MFRALGAFTYRRRWPIVAAWGVILALGVLSMGAVGGRLSAEFNGSDRLESARVFTQIQEQAATGGDFILVIDDVDPNTVDRSIIDELDRIARIDGIVSVVDPWRADIEALRSGDGNAAVVVVSYANGLEPVDIERLAEEVSELAHGLAANGLTGQVQVGGETIVLQEFETQAERDLARGEAIALPIALVALIIIFGGFRAASLPLAVAGAAFLSAMIALLAATYVLDDVSIFAINVISLLGLGLGIDYGLLLVSRFREERGRGHSMADAIETTVATAGVTVVFSALTVAVAISGMFVFGEPTMTSFGIGGLAAVLLSMIAGLTLLPALLSIIGARIKPATVAGSDGAFFRLSNVVQRFALPIVIVVGSGLALLALPFADVRLENGDARSLPRSSEARAAALTLSERFPARGAEPIVIIAQTEVDDSRVQPYLDSLTNLDDVVGVSIRDGFGTSPVVIDVVPAGPSQGDQAQGLVETIREGSEPFATEVGGLAAQTLDTKNLIAQRAPYAAAVVIVATFVLLFLMTGSVAIPIKAVLLNIVSLGASFGALVWVFQDGNLSGVLGFDAVGSVDMWMPVLIFLFAFGLSMDYEVFLLSRIKEIYDQTGDNNLSVSIGLQRTGRIITSAALLIVVVFGGFATGEVLTIKQLGIGMALAVVVDATIVRSLLVPATMSLLGDKNWWAPAPLRRLHNRFGLAEPAYEPTVDLIPDGQVSGTKKQPEHAISAV